MLDVVTDAIDQFGDAPGLMGWLAPRRHPVSIVSNRWQLRSGVVNHGEFIVLRDLWRDWLAADPRPSPEVQYVAQLTATSDDGPDRAPGN